MRRIVPRIILLLFLAAVSCSQNDGPESETRILADGVWVGSGEGRGGTIIASVEVVSTVNTAP